MIILSFATAAFIGWLGVIWSSQKWHDGLIKTVLIALALLHFAAGLGAIK